jgi:alanyl-tRNA synthetase
LLVKAGLHAGTFLKEALPLIDGQGGGKAESAQGSGMRMDNLEAAIAHVVSTVGR